MVINDKILTLITGAMLAVGGAAVSLFMGESSSETGYEPKFTVVASLSAPQTPSLNSVLPRQTASDIIVGVAPSLPRAEVVQTDVVAGLDRPLVVASLEPAKTSRNEQKGTDLATFAVLDGVIGLAKPAEFSEIVLARAIADAPAPDWPKVATGVPNQRSDMPDAMKLPLAPTLSCALDVRATPIFGARVNLNVLAPCHPNVVVTIKHGGLQFKEVLDGQGKLAIKIPVFTEYSQFDIQLADGTHSTVGAYIAGLSAVERVGISWVGANDTFIHALQDGASMGDMGHIWRLQPSDFETSRMNGRGFMTMLGDPALENAALAQIYTLPVSAKSKVKIVELNIETLRSDAACGEKMAMRIARKSATSGASSSSLSITLADCGQEDTSLVLKNVLKDMKVAQK